MRMLKTDPVQLPTVNKKRRGLKRNGRILDTIGRVGRGVQRAAGTATGVGLAIPAGAAGAYAGAIRGAYGNMYQDAKKGRYFRVASGVSGLTGEYHGAKSGGKFGAQAGYKLGRKLWGLNKGVQNRQIKMLITD